MLEAILQSQNLHAGYGKSIVLHDVTLSLRRGFVTIIIGPNGSGKSTFAKAIFKLATIFSGHIIFKGKDITQLPAEDKVLLGISMAPQSANVFNNLTVKENLEVTYHTLRKRARKEFKESLEHIYTMFPDLKDKHSEKVKNLSGGQKQMVALARTLIVQPELLILDEPTATLSPQLAKLVLSRITDIKELGVTVMLIEQNVKAALNIADYVYVLVSGRKVLEGPAEEFRAKPKAIEDAFFGRT